MSVLSIVMLIASIFFLYLVIRNINKNNILFEQAFMWIVISLVMIFISIFLVGYCFFTNYDFVKTKRADEAFSSRVVYSKKSYRNERGK